MILSIFNEDAVLALEALNARGSFVGSLVKARWV